MPDHPAAEARANDDTTYLSPDECAVVLRHNEADALLAMLEHAFRAGIEPGIGLRVEAAEAAAYKIVQQRFRDQDPYNRSSGLVAVTWRKGVGVGHA